VGIGNQEWEEGRRSGKRVGGSGKRVDGCAKRGELKCKEGR
jgi:hypothetical protein